MKSDHYSICTAADIITPSVYKILRPLTTPIYRRRAFSWWDLPGLSRVTRCILDAGSQSIFISSKLVDTLKLPVMEERDVILSVFESHKPAEKRRLVGFQLQGICTGNKVDVTALESQNTLCASFNHSRRYLTYLHPQTAFGGPHRIFTGPAYRNTYWRRSLLEAC